MGRFFALSIGLLTVLSVLTLSVVLGNRRTFPQAASIVFEIGHRDYDIYSIRPNSSFGEGIRLLFQPVYSLEARYVTGLDCAPGGRALIFWYIFLYRFDLQEERLTSLILGQGLGQQSVWAPDGGRIAYIDDVQPGAAREIFTISADGAEKTQVTDNDVQETSLSWSPEGEQIAFTYRQPGKPAHYGLATADVERGTTTPLFESEMPVNNASWSPDGRRIAFERAFSIYTIWRDGGNPTRLTQGDAQNILPRWSPDGTLISYSSRGADGYYALYVMDADGSNPYLVFYDANEDNVFNRCWLRM